MFIRIVVFAFLLVGQQVSATEIHNATSNGDLNTVKLLLQQTPSLIQATDDRQRTPLHLAAAEGHLEIVRYLLETDADIEAKDDRYSTPLITAIMNNHFPVVQLLVDRGADLHAEHQSYGPAIEIAYWFECMKGQSGMTELLISRGVPFDFNSESAIATRLNLATTFGNYEMAKFAMDNGADVNKVSTLDGMTELHFAACCGHPDIVKLLLDHGASAKVSDNNGNPPLLHAIQGRYARVCRLLLDNGAVTAFVDEQTGRTLLHIAALKGSKEIVEMLISTGLDVNDRDHNGNTPINYAGKYGHKQVADILLQRGAERLDNIEENYGKPLHLSRHLKEGEAIIWCLDKNGWVIKTMTHLLVFNSFQTQQTPPTEPSLTNGYINASEIADQNVYVLYSTFHWPELVEYIHSIEDSLSNVTYIHNKQEIWRGCKNTVYIEPYESRQIGDLHLTSIQSNHRNPVLSYLIHIDGMFFFLGSYSTDDLASFSRDIDSLASTVDYIDIAFLPIPASGSEDNSDLTCVVDRLHPEAVCFLSSTGRIDRIQEVSEKMITRGYKSQMFGADNAGDIFIYKRD